MIGLWWCLVNLTRVKTEITPPPLSQPLYPEKLHLIVKVPFHPRKYKIVPFFLESFPLDQPHQFSPSEPELGMDLVCFFIKLFSDQFLHYHPEDSAKPFSASFWKLKTLRQEKKTSIAQFVIGGQIFPKKIFLLIFEQKWTIFFIENVFI